MEGNDLEEIIVTDRKIKMVEIRVINYFLFSLIIIIILF